MPPTTVVPRSEHWCFAIAAATTRRDAVTDLRAIPGREVMAPSGRGGMVKPSDVLRYPTDERGPAPPNA